MAKSWMLIFSDGTGQRGVPEDPHGKNSNVYRMYLKARQSTAKHKVFYDAGIGTPEDGEPTWATWGFNLAAKATGLGISQNIAECYAAIMNKWLEGMPIGFFGFSRGAYTVRSLGGVLSACGVATRNFPRGDGKADREKRYKIAMRAVKIYQINPKEEAAKRERESAAFRQELGCADVMPDAIGVFDTVRALGLPGATDMLNPIRHMFHDNYLSPRVKVGLQAYAIDENRKIFKPEPWADDREDGSRVLEQVWFPGVHSDIGGTYGDDRGLADHAFEWMTRRLWETSALDLRNGLVNLDSIYGKLHNERTGLGVFWLPGTREGVVRKKSRDVDPLCDRIEDRFKRFLDYRPLALTGHLRMPS